MVTHPLYYRSIGALSPDDKRVYSSAKLGSCEALTTITSHILAVLPEEPFSVVTSVPHQHESVLGNPAEWIGTRVAQTLNLPFRSLSRKLRNGQQQYFFYSYEERATLNQETISASREKFSDEYVLLVDDLCASGAVLETCVQKVTGAGARRVVPVVDILIGKDAYQKEREIDIILRDDVRAGVLTHTQNIITGLENGNTIFTKRLLEFLFASGLNTSEFDALTGGLSDDMKSLLHEKAARYFATTKSVLSVPIKV